MDHEEEEKIRKDEVGERKEIIAMDDNDANGEITRMHHGRRVRFKNPYYFNKVS